MYTPVMVLSIIGFYQLYKNYRQLFWTLALFTALNIYLVSAWDIWWYGGSFSMRALIQSYPLLMFPMGAFLNDVLRRRYLKYPILAFLIFCTWLNLIMTYQMETGTSNSTRQIITRNDPISLYLINLRIILTYFQMSFLSGILNTNFA